MEIKPQKIIELRNISQTYNNGESFVIKDLNLIIEDIPQQGQFITFLGPSGCGKTTLLRYITGLQKPTSGEVLLLDKPKTEEDRVGMVFQKYSSFPWLTVLENVELGLKLKGISKKERKERAWEMLRVTGLEDQHWKYAQYPTLSGGQLQRVAIARSLLANQRLLMLDEPFGALDIKTRLSMQDNLVKIWEDMAKKDELVTFILVTHDISEAVYLSDEIYILSTAPANILEKIKVNLPYQRNKEVKRSDYFKDLVNYIEDKMMLLEKK